MPKSFRERFLAEAGERPYEWAVSLGLSKDLVTAVKRGDDDYQPIRRTLDKIASATGRSVSWWLTGDDGVSATSDASESKATAPTKAAVAGVVAAGSSSVDIRKLELAIQALDEWEATRNISIPTDRRPAVIAVLYDFLVKSNGEGSTGIDVVLRALG